MYYGYVNIYIYVCIYIYIYVAVSILLRCQIWGPMTSTELVCEPQTTTHAVMRMGHDNKNQNACCQETNKTKRGGQDDGLNKQHQKHPRPRGWDKQKTKAWVSKRTVLYTQKRKRLRPRWWIIQTKTKTHASTRLVQTKTKTPATKRHPQTKAPATKSLGWTNKNKHACDQDDGTRKIMITPATKRADNAKKDEHAVTRMGQTKTKTLAAKRQPQTKTKTPAANRIGQTKNGNTCDQDDGFRHAHTHKSTCDQEDGLYKQNQKHL